MNKKQAEELLDLLCKIANELHRLGDLYEDKKDWHEYDGAWADIPGMEKSNG